MGCGDKWEGSVSGWVGTASGSARPNPRWTAFEDWLWISPPPRPSLLLFVTHLHVHIVFYHTLTVIPLDRITRAIAWVSAGGPPLDRNINKQDPKKRNDFVVYDASGGRKG